MYIDPNDLRSCSMAGAFLMIGGKWKPHIIWYLNIAPNCTLRYGELKRDMPWKISHKVFAQQLRELEEDQIIERHDLGDIKRPHVEYTLTERGKFLAPALLYLRDWGNYFGERFDDASLARTQGCWRDDTISYGYESSEHPGLSVHISFSVDKTKPELEAGVSPDAKIVIEEPPEA